MESQNKDNVITIFSNSWLIKDLLHSSQVSVTKHSG